MSIFYKRISSKIFKSWFDILAAPNIVPTANFNHVATGKTVAVDASTSRDFDGNIVAFEWDFGDGTGLFAGVSQTHVYASAGSYNIQLKVTDNESAQYSNADLIIVIEDINSLLTDTSFSFIDQGFVLIDLN